MTQLWETKQKRRHPRIPLVVEVLIVANGAILPGQTQDISESGVSVIIPVELQVGAEVELQIKFPAGTQAIHAVVRHRNVYRHGFEFAQPLVGPLTNDTLTSNLYLKQGDEELQK